MIKLVMMGLKATELISGQIKERTGAREEVTALCLLDSRVQMGPKAQ